MVCKTTPSTYTQNKVMKNYTLCWMTNFSSHRETFSMSNVKPIWRLYKFKNMYIYIFLYIVVIVTLTSELLNPHSIHFFPTPQGHRHVNWSKLGKIKYKVLQIISRNENEIYSNSDLDHWPLDPKLNRFLSLFIPYPLKKLTWYLI
jgi:magnesium-transporting ATPase (P-type)